MGELQLSESMFPPGGVVSTIFVKALLWQRAAFLKVAPKWRPFAPAAGGLVVGALALAVPGVLGVGYNLVGEALNGQMALKMMLLLLALKIVATSSAYGSGNAGGIFGPSLFIGAMLGGAVGNVAHGLFPDHTGSAGAYALVGMGAAFAGIIRTPMTSVIMIFEVTRDNTIIVPLMIANLCSYFLAQKLQRAPVYEALSRQDGIKMPSPEHRPEPLTVRQAMRPAGPEMGMDGSVHPDDPLDTALQIIGRSGMSELAVTSRTGGHVVGRLNREDILAAYGALSVPVEAAEPPSLPNQNRLLAVAATTAIAVLILAGLVFWQRSRRTDLGEEAFQTGQRLLSQGRLDDAVSAFRTGLAHTPQDNQLRVALGLALVQTGHHVEASSYLSQASKADPSRGAAWAGLAEAAAARGDIARAVQLHRVALSKEWLPEEERQRWNASFIYARLLGETGKTSEAVSQLMLLIEQKGDDPALGKQAADAVKSIASPQQVEEAMRLLTKQFPADPSAWMRLGDARFAAERDAAALEAYRKAAETDSANDEAHRAVARTEEVLRLDPTRRGLSVRERARRWDMVLQRVLEAVDKCGATAAADEARPLLKRRAASLELSDQKMTVANKLWHAAPPECRSDPVLSHILAKLGE